MDISTFRKDFLERFQASGLTQMQISQKYGVQQAVLSRFMRGLAGLSFDYAMRLWPFVYHRDAKKRAAQ